MTQVSWVNGSLQKATELHEVMSAGIFTLATTGELILNQLFMAKSMHHIHSN